MKRRLCVVLLATVLGTAFFQLRAPASAQSRSSIQGIVVRLGSTDPVSNVDLELTRIEGTPSFPLAERLLLIPEERTGPTIPNPADSFALRTSADGRFRFANLPPGTYRLLAARSGGAYCPAEYGQRDPRGPGVNIVLSEGEVLRDARIELVPTGSISGRIVDENGNPAGRVRVIAIDSHWTLGKREYGVAQVVYSDDLGEYRLYWLPAGRYIVGAQPEDPRRQTQTQRMLLPDAVPAREVFPAVTLTHRLLENGETVAETIEPVYYGGGAELQRARVMDLSPGSSINGIDIALGGGRGRARTIRGIVIDATGQPVKKVAVTAVPSVEGPSIALPSVMSATDGTFELTIGQGSYDLRARITDGTRLAPQDALISIMGLGTSLPSGLMSIPAGGENIDRIALMLKPGLELQGRVTVEGRDRSAIPDISGIQVRLVPDKEYLPYPTTVNPTNGLLAIRGLQPGDYHVTVAPILQLYTPQPNPILGLPGNLPDYYVKSIRLGSNDVLNDGLHVGSSIDSELEIVLGSNGGTIDGRTTNGDRMPVPNATVFLIPEGTSRIRPDLYKSVNSDRTGRFTIRGIVPGDYRLFAWERIEDGVWYDPDFVLANRARGILLQVGEGPNPQVNINVVRP